MSIPLHSFAHGGHRRLRKPLVPQWVTTVSRAKMSTVLITGALYQVFGKCAFSNFVFLQDCVGCLSSLKFHMNLRTGISSSAKKGCWGPDREGMAPASHCGAPSPSDSRTGMPVPSVRSPLLLSATFAVFSVQVFHLHGIRLFLHIVFLWMLLVIGLFLAFLFRLFTARVQKHTDCCVLVLCLELWRTPFLAMAVLW